VLFDTQLVLWYAYMPERLPVAAASALSRRSGRQMVSLASLWEVAIKAALRRSEFAYDVQELADTLVKEGFELLPVAVGHLVALGLLPPVHRDPFARLLVAQAQVERVPLMTADRTLAGYSRAVKVV
jgi:PIN domain nuclease of toxin-antitoxin system